MTFHAKVVYTGNSGIRCTVNIGSVGPGQSCYRDPLLQNHLNVWFQYYKSNTACLGVQINIKNSQSTPSR